MQGNICVRLKCSSAGWPRWWRIQLDPGQWGGCLRSRNETAWIDRLVQAEVMVCVRLSWIALKCGFWGFVCICSKVDILPWVI